MENKKFIIGIFILILFISISSASAEDSLENSTLATSVLIDDGVTHVDLDEEVVSNVELQAKVNFTDKGGEDVLESSEISITSDNYYQYFNAYTGKFKASIDSSKINTIKIGNVSNCIFAFEKPITLMPMDSNCQITNGVIHLLPGSDGSTIMGLKIINNDSVGDIKYNGLLISRAHGIWFTNSSNNLIYNNTIIIGRQYGCYAMPMGYSNNNRILNNTILSGLTSCIVMGRSNNNNISYNHVEILDYEDMTTSNLIFFNPWGHADYLDGGAECNGNYISNNYFKNFGTGIWANTLSLGYYSGDTQVINNTIIKGSIGIQLTDLFMTQPRNITVKGNTIINCPGGISSGSNGVIIDGNKFYGASEGSAIFIQANDDQLYHHNVTISNNYIEYYDLSCAISVHSDNATVFNNEIHLSRYGTGIGISPTDIPKATSNNCIVKNNKIFVVGDKGIAFYGNNTEISNNHISTKNKGIVIAANSDNFYNNTIMGNVIYSDDYGIYVEGHVYNTLIIYNEIESNQSEGIHFNPSGDLGEFRGNVSENIINGVIENTETLIIDDSNFYDYFDKTGYLTYEFKPNSRRMIFFTFLTNKNIYFTDQIILTSNKMPNLLYNVSIKLTADASESSIKDFKFYNFDKSSIILDGVDNVVVKNNEFTVASSNIFDISTISLIGGEGCNITNNDIFMNSKAIYTYAISISSPSNYFINKFSKNFKISDNNILIKATGVAEGIYADSLVESKIIKNTINIISDGSAYGIAICKVAERPYNLTIGSNLISINSKEMSYLIEIYMSDSCDIIDNYLIGYSNGIYGVGVYNSWDININRNEISVSGKPLTDSRAADALGKGNAAIYMNRSSKINSFSYNIMDVENSKIIVKDIPSIINNFNTNKYVIAEYNYDIYFNSQNKLIGNVIKEGSVILFRNFTSSKIMDVNIPITIKPYKHLNNFSATLILSGNANNSTISGFNFNNTKIMLNNVYDVKVFNNSFISSKISDVGGLKNLISSNLFEFKLNNTNGIIFEDCNGDIFSNNRIFIESSNSNFLSIKESNGTKINNNSINADGDSIVVIKSDSSSHSKIFENNINITSKGNFNVYRASKVTFDEVLNNVIKSNGILNNAIVYYDSSSSNNKIKYNYIISFSNEGEDYTVVFDTIYPLSNIIANNYLISSNGYKRGDDAVYALFETVCNNTPVTIYVSSNSTDEGNGTFSNPYPTIKKAIENSLSGAIIYIFPGYYRESNLTIDKNITLTAINNDGSVYIDASNNQLFTITKSGSLTVNALKIFNGFSVEGGSLFNNLGFLVINNSIIYNSSSYYDNSHPTFKFTNIRTRTTSYSYDCENLGLGGAILNYGNLLINSSTLFDNFAHKGGAIADFGKTSIKNSLIFNNTAVHGGAIFTDSSSEFNIENSIFLDNLAIQTLDYCYIQRESLNSGGYTYRPLCNMGLGYGGAIFSNSSVIISNSLFERNIAKSGGAIGQYSWVEANSNVLGPHYFARNDNKVDESIFHYVPKLTIENSVFRYNEAKDTSCGNLSMITDKGYTYYYSINYNGGAIFGALNQLKILDSLFEHNTAHTVGGALCVQCEDSVIEGCRFYNNTAGENGGAIESFGTFKIFNTELIENHAKRGGAIKYASYNAYGHTQNIMNLFNVTVAGNNALVGGGAFVTQVSNFAISNSNIYGNMAPNGNTFYGMYNSGDDSSYIDARNNWWGSVDGPDDSVWNNANSRFRTWLSEKVNWNVPNVSGGSSTEDSPGGGNNGGGSSYIPSQISTGSGMHTGSTLTNDIKSYGASSKGFTFTGNWPSGSSNGLNNGGTGEGNGISSNGGSGEGNGISSYRNSGNSRTNILGNANNPNSLSKVNSSNVNDLSSVGMSANAADASSSSSSHSEGSSVSGSSNSYEITENVKKEIDQDLSIFNVLLVFVWMFFFIGFYIKFREEKEN